MSCPTTHRSFSDLPDNLEWGDVQNDTAEFLCFFGGQRAVDVAFRGTITSIRTMPGSAYFSLTIAPDDAADAMESSALLRKLSTGVYAGFGYDGKIVVVHHTAHLDVYQQDCDCASKAVVGNVCTFNVRIVKGTSMLSVSNVAGGRPKTRQVPTMAYLSLLSVS